MAPPPRQAMTMVASQAMNFAEMFDLAFRGGLSGPVPFRIELTKPEGGSTAGGKQILQHIKLVPVQGGPATVMGSVNGVEARVEIRSVNYLVENHRRRFKGAVLPIDPAAYDRIVRAMQAFFTVQRFSTTIVDEVPSDPEEDAAAYAAQKGGGMAITAVAILAVFVLTVAIVGVILLARR